MEDTIFGFLAKLGRLNDRFFTQEHVVGGFLVLCLLIYAVVDFICVARENRRRNPKNQSSKNKRLGWLIYSLIHKYHEVRKHAAHVKSIAKTGRTANSPVSINSGGEERRAQIRRNVRRATQSKKPGKVIDPFTQKPDKEKMKRWLG